MQDLFPPNGCANGGTCLEDGSCSCPSDIFTGRYCDTTALPCSDPVIKDVYPDDGCANGGVCDDATGNCICDPVQDNLGRYCQEEFFLNATAMPNDVAEARLRHGSDY